MRHAVCVAPVMRHAVMRHSRSCAVTWGAVTAMAAEF